MTIWLRLVQIEPEWVSRCAHPSATRQKLNKRQEREKKRKKIIWSVSLLSLNESDSDASISCSFLCFSLRLPREEIGGREGKNRKTRNEKKKRNSNHTFYHTNRRSLLVRDRERERERDLVSKQKRVLIHKPILGPFQLFFCFIPFYASDFRREKNLKKKSKKKMFLITRLITSHFRKMPCSVSI